MTFCLSELHQNIKNCSKTIYFQYKRKIDTCQRTKIHFSFNTNNVASIKRLKFWPEKQVFFWNLMLVGLDPGQQRQEECLAEGRGQEGG